MSRIVELDVNLKCLRCKKKIRKVLGKYQDEWNIKTVTYDERNNKVILSGPFDPHKLVKKLCKKASEVIREWCIKEPPTPKPADPSKPAPPTKPEPPIPAPPPKPADPPKKPDPPKADPPKKPDPPKADPPKKPDPPPKPEPPKPCADPPPCLPTGYPYPYPYPYPLPVYYPWGGCDGQHNKPCSCGGTCGGYRPCACGCGGGCSGAYLPQQPTYVDYGRPCHWVCEEEPAAGGCSIM